MCRLFITIFNVEFMFIYLQLQKNYSPVFVFVFQNKLIKNNEIVRGGPFDFGRGGGGDAYFRKNSLFPILRGEKFVSKMEERSK